MASEQEERTGNLTQFKKEDFENDWIPIALGGFGKVYKVRHKKWWSVYALKCSTSFPGDPELESTNYNNLMEEASKMEKIKFRYIVQIYGICINPLGIVMEFMENGSLEKLIPTHTLSWQLKFRFIHEIALGMNFLHIMNPPLLHLDLKPGNILLDEHLHVKISDFGLSKWKENSTHKEYIERSAIKGTLNYIPPEMFLQSSRVAGTKYDVYSYSIVIWELLTQKKPFAGNSMMTVIIKVAAGQRPPIEDISEDGPVECQQMIDLMKRCWDQIPSKRPCFSDIIVESHMLLCLLQSPLPEHDVSWSKSEQELKSSAAIFLNGNSDVNQQPSSSLSSGTESLLNTILEENNEDIAWVDENNFTLLHFAVAQGNFERVNHFIHLNANVNSRTISGYTPLILAVQRKQLDICVCLIENGADVNITDEDKWSPLHFAAQGGDDRMARLLLDHGAHVDAKERDDWTPLHLASQNGFENVVRVLFTRQSNPNLQDIDGKTSLHLASYFGHYKIVQLLISQGADPNGQQKNHRTPLHIAADRSYFRVVQHLIKKGAHVNCTDKSLYSPLHMAAVKGNSLICKHLIKHNAQVNIKTQQGWTPLHLAVFKGHIDIIHLLKDSDVSLNATGHMTWTALHLAVRYNEDTVISILLDMGADPNVVEMSGWTPLHLAVQRGSFFSAIKLIEKKADVNAQNMFGWTPLHVAVLNSNAAIIKTLLRANAKKNIQDNNGCTPLQLAIRNQKHNIVSLLENGTELSNSSCSSAEPSEDLGPYLNFQTN